MIELQIELSMLTHFRSHVIGEAAISKSDSRHYWQLKAAHGNGKRKHTKKQSVFFILCALPAQAKVFPCDLQ